jgi:hypothetical protein
MELSMALKLPDDIGGVGLQIMLEWPFPHIYWEN